MGSMKLLQAYLDIHSSCNYNCTYCYRGQPGNEKMVSGPMEVDVFKKIVPILRRMCWSVSLSCAGELLLHPDLQGILTVVNRDLQGLDLFLVTNGFLLNERAGNILANSVLSKVSISVDTVDPNLYATLCGCSPHALAAVLANIESFAQTIRRNRRRPKLYITAIAMKSTLPLLPDLARKFSSIGVDGIKIQWLVPWSAALEHEMAPRARETFAVLDEVSAILKSNHIFFEYPDERNREKAVSVIAGVNQPGTNHHIFCSPWRN